MVVDMAAANGGNVEPTEADRRVVTGNGVVVLGWTDLAGRMATQTSQLYGTNVVNLLTLLTPGKAGELVLDVEDVVQRGSRSPTAERCSGHRPRSRCRRPRSPRRLRRHPRRRSPPGAVPVRRWWSGSRRRPSSSSPWPPRRSCSST